MNRKPHIIVIDPARQTPEIACFNNLVALSPLPLTYHLPAMFGFASLEAEDMAAVKAIIILGSASSIHDRLPWQERLEAWLRPLLEGGMPTMGLCYGHQMLAYMFGGEVGYVFPDRKKHLGFREVSLKTPLPWAMTRQQGPLCVSHRETVLKAPAEMEVMATSPAITIDGLKHRQWPIFSFQPHPEATPEFLANHDIPPATDPSTFRFGHELLQGFLTFAASR